MYTIDRYVLRNFIKVFAICFVCACGMYVVGHFVDNFSEFVDHAGNQENLWLVLGLYYGARLPWFFDLTSRIVALIAAVFVVTWLQRHNEMTALMAAGISRLRIVGPLIGATLTISLLAAANRELGIPAVRRQLCRRSQDWVGDGGRKLSPTYDHGFGIWIGGHRTYFRDRRISAPSFRLPAGLIQSFGRRIAAPQAVYHDANEDHAGGYLLQHVTEPTGLAELPSATVGDQCVIYSPRDTAWLEKNECFVVSNVSFEQLESGGNWYRFASTAEILRGLHNRTIEFASDVRVHLHSRLIQPLLDMTLLFLGLPIVMSRHNRNVFVAVGLCVLLVAGFSITVLAFQALGTNYLIRPSLAAWCPLMVFVPWAVRLSRQVWR